METNLEQQSPKLNVTNVSSAVFGKEEGATLGKESSIGKLSRILRTTRLKVNEVEKSITGISAKFLEIDKKITLNTENITGNTKKTETNAEKITRLKNILQNQKSNIGEKLPGSTEEKEKAKLNTTLTETNRILVEIQKQLAYDFAMRVAEDKQEVAEDKEATSKERFKREESALEKSAKAMVSTVKTATKKIVSPIGNIFQKLLAFIGILGKGILVNAAFDWFKDPENQKKIKKFFSILSNNWKLIAKILLSLGAAVLIGKIIAFIGAISGVVSFLASGPVLAALGLIAAAAYGFFGKTGSERTVEELMAEGGDDNARKLMVSRIDELLKLSDEDLATNLAKNPGSGIKDAKDIKTKGVRQELSETAYFLKTGKQYSYGLFAFAQDNNKIMRETKFEEGLDFSQYKDSRTDNIFGYKLPFGLEAFNIFDTSGGADTIQQRYMGGPVMSGNTYLVGERGPELFSPNIDGSIVNNMRTEKIYQMLASGKRGRTRIVELPPQTIEGPKPEIKMPRGPATKAPKISSSNSLDGYRSVSSGIYGIMV